MGRSGDVCLPAEQRPAASFQPNIEQMMEKQSICTRSGLIPPLLKLCTGISGLQWCWRFRPSPC
ncbi:hypothetical protein TRIP_B40157 [uncultured Desulfatiglans sp.]|uniref:Uncharacterized protein n=1 Tax=Uncultured Desulfatiglans sp. TaxID=1748965 RepID=A0A653ADV0_UNCDX|nr:hypothetical protein TRIP_B40157 [uncultured Desulfatiglans sp.]